MTDGDQTSTDLTAAARAREEKARLEQRLESARSLLASTQGEVGELRTRLADENELVERLESFSPTRIWATLKGSRAGDLDRETAEREAARYAVAAAEARCSTAERDIAGLEAQLADLGDVDARYAAALAVRDEWLRANGSPASQELADIALRRGELAARDTESREAHAAGLAARDLLTHAGMLLGSAHGWSNWDSFGGGGMLTDLAKYDKMDQATAVLREADGAVAAFTRELADVGLTGVDALHVDGMTKAFDVFFDNIFTDMAVRSRIVKAAGQVEQALDAVTQALAAVESSGQQVAAELSSLDARREQLLLGA